MDEEKRAKELIADALEQLHHAEECLERAKQLIGDHPQHEESILRMKGHPPRTLPESRRKALRW
jgi:hypothetical protein